MALCGHPRVYLRCWQPCSLCPPGASWHVHSDPLLPLLLPAMSASELVQMLRSKARKSTSQTSTFRGVSLLKQTGKWHAQINVNGKQVHMLVCRPLTRPHPTFAHPNRCTEHPTRNIKQKECSG